MVKGKIHPLYILGNVDEVPIPDSVASSSATIQEETEELRRLNSRSRLLISEGEEEFWKRSSCDLWNEFCRETVATHKTNPPRASRAYALLSVAQSDALAVVVAAHLRNGRPESQSNGVPENITTATRIHETHPSEHAAVAAASYRVLRFLYPSSSKQLQKRFARHLQSRLLAGSSYRSELEAGEKIGNMVASRVIERAKSDRANSRWDGVRPDLPERWRGKNPMLPQWGKVRPWLVEDITPMRLPPPPESHSKRYRDALAEVRLISEARSHAHLRVAMGWADGPGSYTPPGHWNAIALQYFERAKWDDFQTAPAMAIMNVAMCDAGICCWDTKYAYWLKRPSHVDRSITTSVGLPNFPSYPSGHSMFSGAAATILSHFLPEYAAEFSRLATEASLSRIWGGIHFRFDCEDGMVAGQAIARLALKKYGYADASEMTGQHRL